MFIPFQPHLTFGNNLNGENLVRSVPLQHSVRDNVANSSFSALQTRVPEAIPISHNINQFKTNFSNPNQVPDSNVIDSNAVTVERQSGYRQSAYVSEPGIVKGHWSLEEDRKLQQLVQYYGIKKWGVIAKRLGGRVGKQCRERWQNHLKPDIRKDKWIAWEDQLLIEAHKELGTKWSEIAKKIPGRSENAIKNRWNCAKRQQMRVWKGKGRRKNDNILIQHYIASLGNGMALGMTSQSYRQSADTDTDTATTMNIPYGPAAPNCAEAPNLTNPSPSFVRDSGLDGNTSNASAASAEEMPSDWETFLTDDPILDSDMDLFEMMQFQSANPNDGTY